MILNGILSQVAFSKLSGAVIVIGLMVVTALAVLLFWVGCNKMNKLMFIPSGADVRVAGDFAATFESQLDELLADDVSVKWSIRRDAIEILVYGWHGEAEKEIVQDQFRQLLSSYSVHRKIVLVEDNWDKDGSLSEAE